MIDASLHGISLGSLLATLAATLGARSATASLWSFRLFCLAAAGFVIFTSPLSVHLTGPPFVIVRLLSAIGVGAFWLFATTLFSQRKLSVWQAFPLVTLAGFALPQAYLTPRLLLLSKVGFDLIELALVSDVIYVVWRDAQDDLVNARHALRGPLVVAIALACLIMTGLKLATLVGFSHDTLRTVQSSLSTALALAGAYAFTQERPRLFESSRVMVSKGHHRQAQNEIALDRLKSLSQDHDLWRRPNLTIGGVAQHLQIPEYRLRGLINRQLGYRNFSEFLNQRRIALAKRDLRDPDKMNLQIAAIAFDLGYASLAPFNRAFREQAGMSPREWRNSIGI